MTLINEIRRNCENMEFVQKVARKVVQEEAIWKQLIGADVQPKHNACELYFEERDIEAFVEKLERLYPETCYVNHLIAHSWGQKVVRFYDPDGNLIEVGSPMARFDIREKP